MFHLLQCLPISSLDSSTVLLIGRMGSLDCFFNNIDLSVNSLCIFYLIRNSVLGCPLLFQYLVIHQVWTPPYHLETFSSLLFCCKYWAIKTIQKVCLIGMNLASFSSIAGTQLLRFNHNLFIEYQYSPVGRWCKMNHLVSILFLFCLLLLACFLPSVESLLWSCSSRPLWVYL